METITYQAMPPDIRATWADRVMRVIIPVSAVIGLFLLLGFYQPEAEDKRILLQSSFCLAWPAGYDSCEHGARKRSPPHPAPCCSTTKA